MFKKWVEGALIGAFICAASPVMANNAQECKSVAQMKIMNHEVEIEYADGTTVSWRTDVPSQYLPNEFGKMARYWEDLNHFLEELDRPDFKYMYIEDGRGSMIQLDSKHTPNTTVYRDAGGESLRNDATKLSLNLRGMRLKSYDQTAIARAIDAFRASFNELVKNCAGALRPPLASKAHGLDFFGKRPGIGT